MGQKYTHSPKLLLVSLVCIYLFIYFLVLWCGLKYFFVIWPHLPLLFFPDKLQTCQDRNHIAGEKKKITLSQHYENPFARGILRDLNQQ